PCSRLQFMAVEYPINANTVTNHKTPRTDQGADVGVVGRSAFRRVPRSGATRCGQYYANQSDDSLRGHGPCPSWARTARNQQGGSLRGWHGAGGGEPTDSRQELSGCHSPFTCFGGLPGPPRRFRVFEPGGRPGPRRISVADPGGRPGPRRRRRRLRPLAAFFFGPAPPSSPPSAWFTCSRTTFRMNATKLVGRGMAPPSGAAYRAFRYGCPCLGLAG